MRVRTHCPGPTDQNALWCILGPTEIPSAQLLAMDAIPRLLPQPRSIISIEDGNILSFYFFPLIPSNNNI